MSTLTITAKGQITLNKALLRHLDLKPGDKLDVAEQPGRKITIAPVSTPRTGRMSDAFGMLYREGQRPLSLEEIDNAIALGRVEDDERIKAEWRSSHA